jgi:hypothetical protein
MSTIYLDVENESNKISIKTEIFLIFHIPSFWDLNSLIIPHKTIDAIDAGGSVFFFSSPILCWSQIGDHLEDDLVKSGYR